MNYLYYAFFASIPFLQATIVGHVYIPEILLALIASGALLSRREEPTPHHVQLLDVAVIAYAGFSLISVIVGIESLYESARHYRTMVLAPTLAYAILRYSPIPIDTLRNAFLWMMPSLVFQAGLFILYYIQHGQRPVGIEGVVTSSVTVSLLLCIASAAAFYFVRDIRKKPLALGLILVGCFFVTALFFSGGRMAMASFVLLCPLAPFVCRSSRLWRLQSICLPAVMLTILLIVIVGVRGTRTLQAEGDRKRERTIERLYSLDLYKKDIQARFAFWSAITKEAMAHPIFGAGADRFSIGDAAGVGFNLGSSHNALVSAMVVSGVPGAVLLLLLVTASYSSLRCVLLQVNTPKALGMVLWVGLTSIVFIALTNDLTGGRMFLWFTLMGIAAHYASMYHKPLKRSGKVGHLCDSLRVEPWAGRGGF